MSARPISACMHPWQAAHVNDFGDLRPCCFAPRAVGNVVEAGSFENLWNGPVMRDLRRSIRDGWVHPVCRGAGCSFARETERSLGMGSYKLDYRLGSPLRPVGWSPHVLTGWALPEPWGIWSTASVARLAVRPTDRTSSDLELRLNAVAFLPTPASVLKVGIRANGLALGTWLFQRTDGQDHGPGSFTFGNTIERRVVIPRTHVADDAGLLVLDFEIDAPRSPSEFGITADTRRLGMGLGLLVLNPMTTRRRLAKLFRTFVRPSRTIQYATPVISSGSSATPAQSDTP